MLNLKLISFEFEDILNTGQMLALSFDRLQSREGVTPTQLRLAGLPVATPLIGKYLETGRAEFMIRAVVGRPILTVNEASDLIVREGGMPAIGSMIKIPGGGFFAGNSSFDSTFPNELPAHPVRIRPFLISPYPVTIGEYARFISDGGYSRDEFWSEEGIRIRDLVNIRRPNCFPEKTSWKEAADFPSRYKKPVHGLSWYEAEAYLNWAGQRFPTEHEWEYAARGGLVGKHYPWGDLVSLEEAHFGKQTSWGPETVNLYNTGFNGFGLKDMAGNVFEWVSDWYGERYYKELAEGLIRNPEGPEEGKYKVLRGGCWVSLGRDIQVQRRHLSEPFTQDNFCGFRAAGELLDA